MSGQFGDLIRSWRQRSGLSLRAVAAHLGISTMTLCNAEHGRGTLRRPWINALVQLFERPATDFQAAVEAEAMDTGWLTLPDDPAARRFLVTLCRHVEKKRLDNRKVERILKIATGRE